MVWNLSNLKRQNPARVLNKLPRLSYLIQGLYNNG